MSGSVRGIIRKPANMRQVRSKMVNTNYAANVVKSYTQNNPGVKSKAKNTPVSVAAHGGAFAQKAAEKAAEKDAERAAFPHEETYQQNVPLQDEYHGNITTKGIISSKKNFEEIADRGMTLQEYKKYIHQKIDSLYTHPSQRGLCPMIEITDAAYKRMMSDPEYEKKVLNMLAAEKAHYYGRFIPEFVYIHIDENWENTYTKIMGWRDRQPAPRNTSNNKKSWWDERQERIREMLKRQAKAAQKRAQAQSILGRQAALERQMESQQTRQSLFAEKIPGASETSEQIPFSSTSAKALAASFYAEALSIFSKNLINKK